MPKKKLKNKSLKRKKVGSGLNPPRNNSKKNVGTKHSNQKKSTGIQSNEKLVENNSNNNNDDDGDYEKKRLNIYLKILWDLSECSYILNTTNSKNQKVKNIEFKKCIIKFFENYSEGDIANNINSNSDSNIFTQRVSKEIKKISNKNYNDMNNSLNLCEIKKVIKKILEEIKSESVPQNLKKTPPPPPGKSRN